MTSPELENLVRLGHLKREPRSQRDFDNLVKSGAARLADADNSVERELGLVEREAGRSAAAARHFGAAARAFAAVGAMARARAAARLASS
jgi:hypothetical protein